MSYFKQPKKSRKPSNVDGFVTKSKEDEFRPNSDVHSRFRKSYRPNSGNSERLPKNDGFVRRESVGDFKDSNLEESEILNEFSQSIESHSNDVKRRRFGFRKKDKSHKKKKPVSKFKKATKAFAVLLVAAVIGVASLFGYGYLKARNIFKGDGEGAAALQDDVDPAKLNGEGDGRVNILLIGKGGPGHEAPDLTDTLLLASIDPIQNEASLVSVPRDMWVQNENGYSSKINAVYSFAKQARLANGNDGDSDVQAAEDAGLSAVKNAVSDVLGIPVHYYVMVDFIAFENAINTVGGITVDVKEPLYDSSVAWLLGGNPLVAGEGLQTFDGERALLYARSRKGSSRGDFDRTERQREIIVALQKKVLSLGTFANPFKVVDLLNNLGDHVRTDLNGLSEIKRLYEIGQNISDDKITSIGLADPPNILVRTDNISGQSVVVPTEGIYQYDDIRSYIRNTIRDPFLKREDARVLILNGTTVAGLATATMEELKSYGYNVIGVDNAPTSNYIQNVLIDNTNGDKRYTKSYLERRVGLDATTELPEGVPGIDEADFVIILGTDEVNKTAN